MPLHYAVLASVSERYSPLEGRLLTCYSPVRHFMHSPKGALIVRLACLRHAASVDSEPGSNSRWFLSHFFPSEIHLTCPFKPKLEANFIRCSRINTWTYISSFQISTFEPFGPSTHLRGETTDYTEAIIVVKHTKAKFQLLFTKQEFAWRQSPILYAQPSVVKFTSPLNKNISGPLY